MKGTITRCFLELLDESFGAEKTQEIIEKAQVSSSDFALRNMLHDVPDEDFLKLFQSTLEHTPLNAEAACDAFGEYWCCTYVPKNYGFIVEKFNSAREMILGMDKVHKQLTATMKNASPPEFDYAWKSEHELEVTYRSKRELIDVYVGLARGVGKLFNEELNVNKQSDTTVLIRFPA